MTNRARIIVFAYHEVGYRCLEWLLAQGEAIVAVFTHKDDPRERVWFRSVEDLARAHGLPVFTPSSLKEADTEALIRALKPDIIYSFYYRYMLPGRLLQIPGRGAFNMHGSLLPRYRGRVPINWAIIQGEKETGATLHHMVTRADAGDIVDQQAVPIEANDTARDVFLKVVTAAVAVLARHHAALCEGRGPRRAQDEGLATTFGARTPEDGRITWSSPGRAIFDLVRALTEPYPGAFSEVRGERFLVWWGRPLVVPTGPASTPGQVLSVEPLSIATGDGAFFIEKMEWARAQPLPPHEFVVGQQVGR